MPTDLKKLQEYPIDIHNFSYDVNAMVNNIYLGPQGELLEQINDFNERHNTDLAITKSFTLKPGGYNKIKEAYSKYVLRWDMKPSGISSLFRRIRDYGWRFNGFRDELANIEQTMMRLRSSGLQWQNNTDDFHEELELTKTSIINSLEIVKDLYSNVTVEVKMMPIPTSIGSQGRSWNGRMSLPALHRLEDMPLALDYCVTFIVHINSPTMRIHIMRSDETIDQVEVKCGDIIAFSGASLLQMISRNWGRDVLQHTSVNSRSRYYLEAIYLDNMNTSNHPYISKTHDKYAYEISDDNVFSGNICTGNMMDELRSTIVNTQIEAHITYLVTWLTNYYIPQTNPLNRINRLRRYGQDRQFVTISNEYNAFDVSTNPTECTFGEALNSRIQRYAHHDSRRYNSMAIHYVVGSTEYTQRAEEYIQRIDIKDFPCNNCMHNLDCDTQTNIMLFLKEDLTPMEEAYIAMFLELRIIGRNVITFTEELVIDAFRHRIDEEYDHLVLNVPAPDLSEHVDEAERPDLPDEIDPGVLEALERAVLTPEELTLRWASRNGGANNL